MDELQGGGREKISCLHTSYLVQESISYNTSRGSNVFVAFLDIKKAFDSVWLPGFLYKLKLAGMRHKPWKMICDAYDSFQCAAYINGKPGPWFTVERGVHQGGPLSMPLYQIYINELINQLKNSNHGCSIGSMDLTCPAHADDISIMALYKRSLNSLLKIAYQYSLKWNFEFNGNKSVVLLWGKDNDPDIPIVLGSNTLKIVECCKHMGIDLTTNKHIMKENVLRRVSRGKNVVYAARGLGSHMLSVPPKALSKIYWSVAVPKITYGLDVTPITAHDLDELDKNHRMNAKCIQSLPQNTPNAASLACLGWTTLRSYVALLKLNFMFRVLSLPANNIYRNVMEFMLRRYIGGVLPESSSSPTASMLKVAVEYGIREKLMNGLVTSDYGNVNENKKFIKRIVKEKEFACWRSTCLLYDSLKLYMSITSTISMNAWWYFANYFPQFTKKVSAVIAVMCGAQPRGMHCAMNICALCASRQPDGPEHVLFMCEALSLLRTMLINDIVSKMPSAMQGSYSRMMPIEKVVFLISGFNCGYYTKEWAHMYRATACFVYHMYKQRHKMYTELALGN